MHAFVLRRRPNDLGLRPDGDQPATDAPDPTPQGLSLSDALHSRFFWLLTLAFSFAYLSAGAIRVHFIPYLIDTGITASTAALASGAIGIMQVAGRVIFAPLDSRLSGRVMVGGVFGLQAAAIAVLLMGSSLFAVGVFIVVFGAAFGAKTLVRPSILAELFGTTHYGRISSVMAVFLTIAATAAPVGAGLIYDHFQSYTPVLWGILALALVSVAVMAVARPDVSITTNQQPVTNNQQLKTNN